MADRVYKRKLSRGLLIMTILAMLLGQVTFVNAAVPTDSSVKLLFDGNTLDSSSNNISVSSQGNPSFVTGRLNQAINFNGTNQYLNLGSTNPTKFGTGDFTVSFWIRSSAVSGDPVIIGNKDWNSGNNTGWALSMQSNGSMMWNFTPSGQSRSDAYISGVADNDWHFITVSHQRNGNATLYKDGAAMSSVAISSKTGTIDTSYPTAIGQAGTLNYSSRLNANIDEMQLFKRALSATEVQDMFSSYTMGSSTKKVLVIGIDGTRPDALQAANTPVIDALAADGAYSYTAQANSNYTWSGTGWSSILTSVWYDKHGVTDNTFSGKNFTQYPSLIQRAEQYNPALSTTSIVNWGPINDNIISGIDSEATETSDDAVRDQTVSLMQNGNPDFTFIHFDDVDHAGHTYGFSSSVPQYINAIEQTDARIGAVVNAIRSRSTYAGEDWLIMLTTDHGGTGTSHGGNSEQERTVFLILNGNSVVKGPIAGTPNQTDVLVTALKFLGVPINPAWNLDGQAIPYDSTLKLQLDGNLQDSSGNNVTVTSQGSPAFVTGQVNQAIHFNGTQQYLNLGNTSNTNFGTGDFSVSFWIRSSGVVNDPAIISNKDWSNGNNTGWAVILQADGSMKWNFTPAGQSRSDASIPGVADSEWHFITITHHRNGNASLYKDSALVTSVNISGKSGSINTNYPTAIGQDGTLNYSEHLNADVDQVQLFKRTLSASEVSNLFNTTKSLNDASLTDLKINGASLNGFAKNTLSYSLSVPNSVTTANVTYTTSDAAATAVVTGGNNLSVGDNPITVTVTAQDGTKRVYSIVVTVTNAVASDPLDQKIFNLTVQNSQLRMDVNGGSTSDGAKIIQWSAGTGLNQQWKFTKTDTGYYKIISQSSSKALAVQNASTADGAGIIQNSYTQDAVYNDEWSVVDVGDGFYQLKNRGSDKVIEIPGSSGAGGEQFVQRTASTGSNQKFLLSLDRTTNDNTTGTGNDQFTYSQGWGYYGSQSGAYNNDNHYSNTVDANVVLHFTGSKVQLYGAKSNNQGIAAVSIDNGTETMVDTYAASRSDQQLLFESTGLSNQDHVLRIRVTGQKNASASNNFISIDRADIQSRIVGVTAGSYFSQSTESIGGVNHTVITLNYAGNDAGEAVNAAIEAAKAAPKPVILDFPTGTYHFKASTAKNAQYYISNASTSGQTPDGARKVGLLFKDINDLTIRGNGSTLMFHGVMTPIVMDHATNVKMNGINIDFNRPVVSEMTVTEVGNNYMRASIHADSWYSIQNNQFSWMGEENWTQNGTQNVGAVQEFDPVTKNTWRVGNPLSGVTDAQDLGNRVVQFNYGSRPNVTVGHTFQLRDTVRREQGTLIYRSKDITWTDVNFYAAPGLGIISQYSENLTLDHLNFAPKAGSGRTNASMADFLQVSGSKGDIRVTNSHFAGAQDDAINVHGTHLQIVQIPSSNQVKVQFMHPESWGFDAFAIGDTIEYVNKSTLLSKESAVVTAVTRVNDTQILLTLDKTVPTSVTANDFVVENATWTPNVSVTNSTFETIPTRGILMTTRGAVRIEGNTFNGMPMSAILIADDANSWYESGMVKDVIIRNNTFNNNGNAVISVEPSTSLANPIKTVHSNILVDGNQFNQSSGDSKIDAKSVNGFTFTNNTAVQGGLELNLDASRAITIAGNSFNPSNVTKKINMNNMYSDEGAINANQGFVVTRTNSLTPKDPNEIPQELMTAVATSSRSGNEASNAIDGDPSTIWHTEWDPKADLPQSITLDLGKPIVISKLRYIPRQNGESNGNITAYDMLTSIDGITFTSFTSGAWGDNSNEKTATFTPVTSRYLKLTATAGHGGFASAAELYVSKDGSDVNYQELANLITTAQSKYDSAVEGNANGQHPVGSKATLQAAIVAAKQTVNLVSVTQQQLIQAVSTLSAAVQTFEAVFNVNVQLITVTSASSTISVKGGTLQLGAEVLPANATNKLVTWAVYEADGTTATDKATVAANGLLTAVKDGTVKVVATAADGSTVDGEKVITLSGQTDIIDPGTDPVNVATINITSAGHVSAINAKNGTLQLGAEVLPSDAANKSVTWAVYEADGVTLTNKASINTNGLLTALKNGTVIVSAIALDGSGTKGSATITISGQSSVTSISVTGEDGAQAITLKDGFLQMHAVVLPAGASSQVTWSIWENNGVSITNKATINASGLLTAMKDGIVKVVATATDGSGIQGSNYIFISGQTPLPTSVPQATFTGPASIQAGASFSTNFGLSNVSDSVSSSVYAADITLTYNANAIDYVSVESLKSGFKVVQTTTDVPGQIRIIAFSEGEAAAITTSGDIFKFNWKAKPNQQSATVNFELTNLEVSNALSQKMDASLANLTVSVTGVEVTAVDKTTLQTVITLAQCIYGRAVEGTKVGQYLAGAKAALLSAISAADLINTNPAATQQQIDVKANALNQALEHFNEQFIRIYELGDANEDGFIDIGDLGKVATNYGKNTNSADWNEIKAADFNNNGTIDFFDLTRIASLIQ